ncbi:MAG: hypothetical protein ACI8W7_004888, partial [Gammaproteobacteria bacterium]
MTDRANFRGMHAHEVLHTMKLLYTPTSPYARRARLAVHVAGL